MKAELCPCGSQRQYKQCCGVYHQGEIAPTAEDLMRSRYSAFVLELKDYLLETWHPSSRPQQLQFDSDVRWLGLKIKACEDGQENDTQGRVSFVARYKINGKAQRLIENSRFIKQQGRWFYLDGEVLC